MATLAHPIAVPWRLVAGSIRQRGKQSWEIRAFAGKDATMRRLWSRTA
jgi:hypothetical protein